MANLKSTSITGSLIVSGSTFAFPVLAASDTGSISGDGKMWVSKEDQEIYVSRDVSFGLGAWSSGGTLIYTRWSGGGAGVTNAGLYSGGYVAPARKTCVEEYDGTSWTVGGSLITARNDGASAGLQDSAIHMAGNTATNTAATEEYNGSSWATGGSLITARRGTQATGAGYQNSAIVMGGYTNGIANNTEEYNGSSWSNGNARPVVAYSAIGTGTQNAALSVGCTDPSISCTVYSYDGSSWSTLNSLLSISGYNGGASGTQDNAIFFGGYSNVHHYEVNEFDGITTSIGCSMNICRMNFGSSPLASSNATFAVGGCNPALLGSSEEFARSLVPPYTFNAAPSSDSWSGGASLLANAGYSSGFGEQNSAVVAAGYNAPATLCATQEYDGSSWSSSGNTINTLYARGGVGTQNAGLVAGGSNPDSNCVEEYNGSTWSAGGALNIDRYGPGSSGTQNAALIAGVGPGYHPSTRACTEEYDGSSWSSGGALSTARYGNKSAGTQNATVTAGGFWPTVLSCVEEYNGTSWSSTTSLIVANQDHGNGSMFGEQNDALYANGRCLTTTSERYNGTSWSTDIGSGLCQNTGVQIGTTTAGMVAGGRNPGYISTVALYTRGSNLCSSTYQKTLSAWSAGGNLITTRLAAAGAGDVTAGLTFGGLTPTAVTCTEEYDGTLWSVGGNMIDGGYNHSGGTGTQTAALSINENRCTEEYNGTSWTAGGALITARFNPVTTGTQNAGLAVGGRSGGTTLGCTEEYNGSSWATGTAISPARYGGAGWGTQNDSVYANGIAVPSFCYYSQSCLYDGTTWSTLANLSNTRYRGSSGGATSNSGLVTSGIPAECATETFNGIAWSKGENVNVSRQAAAYNSGDGGTGSTFIAGGATPTITGITEEYNTNITSVGAWSVVSSLSTARYDILGTGAQTAALAIGGFVSPTTSTCVEEYDGTNWSAGGAIITAREMGGGTGTQDAALYFGGRAYPANINYSCTEEYNGSSWSAGGALISTRAYKPGGSGTQNAGLAFGGYNNPIELSCVEEYDGSTWATATSMITARHLFSSPKATQNSALAAGGYSCALGGAVNCVEEWNGTSWSSQQGNLDKRFGMGESGTSVDSFMMTGGSAPGTKVSCTEKYNGIAWSKDIAYPHNSYYLGGAGSSSSNGVFFGGLTPTRGDSYEYNYAPTSGCCLLNCYCKLTFVTE